MQTTIETPAAFDIDGRLDVLELKLADLSSLVAELDEELGPDGDYAA